jgi:tetratricopeptide (TPR) repeat protein
MADSSMGRAPASSTRTVRREPLTVAILLAAALLLGAIAWVRLHNTRQDARAQDDYTAFMRAALADDAIGEPLQRCLRGPDLPNTHWHRDTTELYCRMLARPTLSFEQIYALLQQGNAAEVDRAFDAYLAAQHHDATQIGVFDQAFVTAGFDSNEAAVRQLVDRWKQLSPQSAAALTASGMQYLDTAMGVPAPNWRNSWPEDAPDNQDALLALARTDLERAIALQPADMITYRELLLTEALQDDTEAMNTTAIAALDADPANFGIRSQLISLAQPLWGQNFGGVDQQLRLTRQQLSRNPLLRIVLSKPAVFASLHCCRRAQLNQLATLLEAVDDNVSIFDLSDLSERVFNKYPAWAAMMFTESLRFQPRDANALHWRAQALLNLGDAAAALDSIQRIAVRYPQNNPIQLQLGWMEAETGHPQQAEQVYLDVLRRDPTNQRAMAWLGDLYNRRLHQPEKAMPLAQRLLQNDPQNPEGLVVQAFADMALQMPDRYAHIHDFLARFGDQPMFGKEDAQMLAYLRNHPEHAGSNAPPAGLTAADATRSSPTP